MSILSLQTLRELLRLSIPIVVSQGAFAVMIFTDRWFMSEIDSLHIAASLGGGVASYFCLSLFLGVISYANALVAQYYGAGEVGKCTKVLTQGIIMCVVCTPFLIGTGFLAAPLFEIMGHDPAQVPLERSYFLVLIMGGGFTLVKAALASYFAGIGRTRVVMISDVLGVLLNIPLSWMLIFGEFGLPQLGIVGAALGTVVSTVFSVALYATFYLSRSHRAQFQVNQSIHYDAGIMRRYLRLGFPSGLESFMNTATFNVFLLMFQSYGVVQGAAIAIVFNWDLLSFIPMIGLNIGVMTLIGRFVGAKEMARTDEVISSGLLVAMIYSGLLAVLFLVFRAPLIDIFDTGDIYFPDIRDLASTMMIGLCTYMMADAIILISGGALRGAGDTRWIMITSISIHWLMLVAQYFIIVVYELGPMVSWWALVAMIILLAAVYLTRLLGGTWREPQRLARVMAE